MMLKRGKELQNPSRQEEKKVFVDKTIYLHYTLFEMKCCGSELIRSAWRIA
jgi:hypothetical protein